MHNDFLRNCLLPYGTYVSSFVTWGGAGDHWQNVSNFVDRPELKRDRPQRWPRNNDGDVPPNTSWGGTAGMLLFDEILDNLIYRTDDKNGLTSPSMRQPLNDTPQPR